MPVLAGMALLAAIAWVYLLAGHGGFWRTDERLPPVDPRWQPERWPSVVAVVPARDEAAILPLTLPSLLAQDYPGEFAVLLVDDGSTDGTAEVAAALGAAAGGGARARGCAGGAGWFAARWLGGQGARHGRRAAGGGGVRLCAVHRRGHRVRAGHADRAGPRGRGRGSRAGLTDGAAPRGHRLGTAHRAWPLLLLRSAVPVPLGQPAGFADGRRGRWLHAGAPGHAGRGRRRGPDQRGRIDDVALGLLVSGRRHGPAAGWDSPPRCAAAGRTHGWPGCGT